MPALKSADTWWVRHAPDDGSSTASPKPVATRLPTAIQTRPAASASIATDSR
ncbi:MAG: hypothetical protein U0470_13050 [Anaerolineae bacterium]